MNTWNPFPFLRITLVFIASILVAKSTSLSYNSNLTYAPLCLTAVYVILILTKIPKKNLILGTLAMIAIFVIGFQRYQESREKNNPEHLLNYNQDIDGYVAKVVSSVSAKKKYYIYQIEILKTFCKDKISTNTGKVQLYIRKNTDQPAPLLYGDEIVIRKSPFRLPPPKNPHEFNYMEYMASKNIYYQQFVDLHEIKVLANDPDSHILSAAFELRNKFEKMLTTNISGSQEAAIAKALILGIRDGLDNDIKKSYSAAGAMHVLAVSGLHVGIIILILSFLLKRLKTNRIGNILATIIILIALWLFAMVTGLSPSILRAATMFSIVIIGQTIHSRANVYNSLALSAFILLFIDPNFLFTVGFQLSYVAVIGIVYIYPRLHRLYIFNNVLAEWVWSITCISMAAQLATFPLTVYYFHQFPVYFLLSNLVVIPAAFVIMCLGIALLTLSSTVLASVIGIALHYLISSVNFIVTIIHKMDFSLIEWLQISSLQTVLIYTTIFGFFALFQTRKFRFLILSALSLLAIIGSGIQGIWQQSKNNQLVFYEIGGEAVFDQIEGLNSQLTYIKEIENEELVQFQVGPNRLSNHLENIDIGEAKPIHSAPSNGIKYYHWKGLKFAFIVSGIQYLDITDKIACDYLVISGNVRINPSKLNAAFDYEQIIVDSSNDHRTCRYYERTLKSSNKDHVILRNEGAYTITI